MTTVALDTLAIVRKLQAAGFPEAQAEAVTTVIRESRDADLSVLATKADLKEVEAGIEALRLSTKADLKEVEARIEALRLSTKADIAESKAEIIKWMLSAIGFQAIVIVGAIVALSKSIH